jgi:hypothetical protein
MAAYSPRTDLLTPSVAPDTQGYGPGLTAGMNNFSRLMEMGITNQRQDDRDQLAYERKTGMMDRSDYRADKKDLMSKAEQSDFAAGAWESIKMRMPGIISPELNDKFMSGGLGIKQGLVLQAQAAYTAAMKSEEARIADERAQKPFVIDLPGVRRKIYGRGNSVMGSVDAFENYGPAGEGATGAADLWNMQNTGLSYPAEQSPFSHIMSIFPKPISNTNLGIDETATGQPATGQTSAPPAAAPARRDGTAQSYYPWAQRR